MLPEFSIGYKKPSTPSPIEVPFEIILNEYEKEDQVESYRTQNESI